MAYALGPVKTHVRAAAEEVGGKFGVRTIYGIGSRSGVSEHPLGLALDFMVYSDTAKGQAIASYVQANASRLGVTYVMWQQQIWSVERNAEGWRAVEDRGSATANHMDHVHVSFSASGAGGGPRNAVGPGLGPDILIPPFWGAAPDAAGSALGAWSFLTSGATWMRVAMFAGGLVLVLIALGALGKAASVAANAARTTKGSVT